MLPKNISDAEVSALFSQYGTIKDLQILRGSQQTSKGTATQTENPDNFGFHKITTSHLI